MPRKKFDLKSMTHNETYAYIMNLKKEINKWRNLYQKTHQKHQDLLLRYEKPKETNKDKNQYFIDGFTLNLSS